MLKIYADLTKFGIVIFVLLTGLAGYAVSFATENSFDWKHLLCFVGGLFFLSSGSLALNQVQEIKLDMKMPRTSKRPLAMGKIKPAAAGILAVSYIIVGSDLLFQASTMAGILGWLSVLLYNVLYTYWWKRHWIFAAIPGALPGALPVTIGYAANNPQIFNLDSIYLFLILFLWQMPHFWVIALRYKEDYAKGGIPTLPVALGTGRTLYHIGIYLFAYVIVAMAAPWFLHANWTYVLLFVPVTFKLLQEFYRFFKSEGQERWLAFFMWINLSVMVYLFVPVIDKWNFLFLPSN